MEREPFPVQVRKAAQEFGRWSEPSGNRDSPICLPFELILHDLRSGTSELVIAPTLSSAVWHNATTPLVWCITSRLSCCVLIHKCGVFNLSGTTGVASAKENHAESNGRCVSRTHMASSVVAVVGVMPGQARQQATSRCSRVAHEPPVLDFWNTAIFGI